MHRAREAGTERQPGRAIPARDAGSRRTAGRGERTTREQIAVRRRDQIVDRRIEAAAQCMEQTGLQVLHRDAIAERRASQLERAADRELHRGGAGTIGIPQRRREDEAIDAIGAEPRLPLREALRG